MDKKPKKKATAKKTVTVNGASGTMAYTLTTGTGGSGGSSVFIPLAHEVKRYGIDLLAEDFGREDINAIARKVNEIIKKLDDHD